MSRVPPDEVRQLVEALKQSTELKKAGRCRRRANGVPGVPDVELSLWKFNDWDYYDKAKCTLPISSRGLFTLNDDKIIIRGYDKFFNVDETERTKRAKLEQLPGPFEVTVKENGCIIFIGALPTGQLVVTLKNSTGTDLPPESKNHAKAGYEALKRQLQTEAKWAQMGHYLYANNLTAVAEYCDDEFEEHVLPYPKERAGLYLHGLNHNTIAFATEPMPEVKRFADEWGFRCIDWEVFEDTTSLFEHLDKCAETGTYKDEEVEGFVVRSGNNFFFKYKFEEPYLLYRQLREVTSKLIATGLPNDIKVKKHQDITRQYLEFVDDLFAKEPQLKQRFIDKVGVIEVRQRFLALRNEVHGIDLLNHMELLEIERGPPKLVLVPVATIGVGKTLVFLILASVYGWPHIQNDNILSLAKKKLVDRTLMALKLAPAALMDRNNSLARERKQIFDDLTAKRSKYLDVSDSISCVGIDFIGGTDDATMDQLWQITWPRVKARGDNHQTLKLDLDPTTVERVMKGFIGRYQPLDPNNSPDDEFDHCINLELRPESLVANAVYIARQLHQWYPEIVTEIPPVATFHKAFDDARNAKVTITKSMALQQLVAYYGIKIDHDALVKLVATTLNGHHQWQHYTANQRVQDEFHITLAHGALARDPNNKAKWAQLKHDFPLKYEHQPRNDLPYAFDVQVQSVIVLDRVICVEVAVSDPIPEVGAPMPPLPIPVLNTHLHITVGTADALIRPFELNQLLLAIDRGESVDYQRVPVQASLAHQRMFASFV